MNESVLEKSARGSIYTIGVSGITIILGFIRSVLLMRLLGSSQFGLIALSLFFTTIMDPLASLGIDSALIQNRNPTRRSFSTHFIIRMILWLVILCLGGLISPVLRRIYPMQGIVVDIFLLFLLINIIQASYATPSVILRRDMKFNILAIMNLIASLAMTITAPLLAYWGAGIWSLVAEQIIGPVVRWIGLYVFIRPWRLSFGFDPEEAKASLKFGFQVTTSSILGVLMDRFDDFWTGTSLGATALGFYSRAWEFAQYPERVLVTPITNVFFSAYAALQENKIELTKAFFRSSAFLVRVGFLIAVVLLVISPELIVILFTAAWLPIVPIFRLMIFYIILDPFYNNLSYLIIGVGHPELLTRVRIIQVILFIVTVIIFARIWGTQGVAWAANLMMICGTVILFFSSRNYVRFSLRRLFQWPLIAAIISLSIGFILVSYGHLAGIWINLIVKSIIVMGIYIIILYIPERAVLNDYTWKILKPIWERLK